MRITLTLSEISDKCRDWGKFCAEFGINYWAINEGLGDTELTLTEEEAYRFGILRKERD
jgi:hypothetical protein